MSRRNRVVKSWQVMGEPFDLETRYKVTDYLGSGAYGMVCNVHDYEDNSNVAIKKCKKIYQSRTLAKRTLREMRLLRQFNHENIVKLKSILLPTDLRYYTDLYLVFEIMDTDLAQIIRSPQHLKEQHTQYFVYQLLRALEYLHSKNIVHRDIKPRNILINADCTLKVADFGLARLYANDGGPESVLAITDYVTTRWYRAPEVIVGWSRYTAAIDMWAVGCIIAELLARAPLFPGENTMKQLGLIIRVMGCPGDGFILRSQKTMFRQYMMTLLNRRATDLSLLVPTASPEAIDLIRRLLDYDPGRRPTATQCLAHPFIAAMSTSLSPPVCSPMCIAPEEFEFEQRKLSIEDLRAEIALEIAYYNQEVVEQLVMDTLEPAPSPSPIVSPAGMHMQSPNPVDLDIADMPDGYADPAVVAATGAGQAAASAENKIPKLRSASNLTANHQNAHSTTAAAGCTSTGPRQHRSNISNTHVNSTANTSHAGAGANVNTGAEDSALLPVASVVDSHSHNQYQHAPPHMPSHAPALPSNPVHMSRGSGAAAGTGGGRDRQDAAGTAKLRPGQKGPSYPYNAQYNAQSSAQYQQSNQPYAGLGPARGPSPSTQQQQHAPPHMQPLPHAQPQAPAQAPVQAHVQAPQRHQHTRSTSTTSSNNHNNYAGAIAGAPQSGIKSGGGAYAQVTHSEEEDEETREIRRDVDALLRGAERSHSTSSELLTHTHAHSSGMKGPAVAVVRDASSSAGSDGSGGSGGSGDDGFADAVMGSALKTDAQEMKVCDLSSANSADQQQNKLLPHEQRESHFVADYSYQDVDSGAAGDIESASAAAVPAVQQGVKQGVQHGDALTKQPAVHASMLGSIDGEGSVDQQQQRVSALQRDRSRTYSGGIYNTFASTSAAHRRSATTTITSPAASSHTTKATAGAGAGAGRARSYTTSVAPLSRESDEHLALMAGYFTCFRDQQADGDPSHHTNRAPHRVGSASTDEEEGKWEDGYDACDYTQDTASRHSSAGGGSGAGSGRYPVGAAQQPGGYADRRNVWENIASSCAIS